MSGPIIELAPYAVPIRAQPDARRNGVGGEQEGHLKVAVAQVAEKGKANRAIIEALCRELSLRKSQVDLFSGETSARKRFLVRGIAADELARRIEASLNPPAA